VGNFVFGMGRTVESLSVSSWTPANSSLAITPPNRWYFLFCYRDPLICRPWLLPYGVDMHASLLPMTSRITPHAIRSAPLVLGSDLPVGETA
jgi:hypothetical protein